MGQIIKNGICYSGGGSGSAVASKLVIDTLWDAIITEPGSYTLAKSIDDYDFLIAAAWGYVGNNTSYEQSNHLVIPKKDYYLRATSGDTTWAFLINSSINKDPSRRVLFSFADDTTLYIARQDTSVFRALYGVKLDQSGSGSGVSPSTPLINYSTEEQVIGTWVGGKPLYQKTIVTNSPSTSAKIFVTMDSNVDIQSIECKLNENESYRFSVPFYVSSQTFASIYIRNCYQLEWVSSSQYFNKECIVTVRYTKSTD